MMGGLFLKWFLGGGWKQMLGAAIVGILVVGAASMYSALQIQKGLSIKYKSERDAALTLAETYETHLNTCLTANVAWEATSVVWNRRVGELTADSEAFRARFAAERARRAAARQRIEELEAEINGAITATDCEGALDQLIAALGWGSP